MHSICIILILSACYTVRADEFLAQTFATLLNEWEADMQESANRLEQRILDEASAYSDWTLQELDRLQPNETHPFTDATNQAYLDALDAIVRDTEVEFRERRWRCRQSAILLCRWTETSELPSIQAELQVMPQLLENTIRQLYEFHEDLKRNVVALGSRIPFGELNTCGANSWPAAVGRCRTGEVDAIRRLRRVVALNGQRIGAIIRRLTRHPLVVLPALQAF